MSEVDDVIVLAAYLSLVDTNSLQSTSSASLRSLLHKLFHFSLDPKSVSEEK